MERANWAQKKLAMSVNDNVYKNMTKIISLTSYDKDATLHKRAFVSDEKTQIVEKLLSESSEEIEKELDTAVDKILISHRNTKIFLFMMTGPFLVVF